MVNDMFQIDERLLSTCILLHQDKLSNVYLKNAQEYPWLILVPRLPGVLDIDELAMAEQTQLLDELTFWSQALKHIYQPDKLNVGALGNIVSMLHIHIIARFKNDLLWPHGIWQAQLQTQVYTPDELFTVLEAFSSFKNQR